MIFYNNLDIKHFLFLLVFNIIPVLKDIMSLTDYSHEGILTKQELINLFKKTRIIQSNVKIIHCSFLLKFIKYFERILMMIYSNILNLSKENLLKIQVIFHIHITQLIIIILDFISYITSDIRNIQFKHYSKEELVLKIGKKFYS